MEVAAADPAVLIPDSCNGSDAQKFQTLYFTGYAQLRNVATQRCLQLGANGITNEIGDVSCGSQLADRWTPVPGPNGLIQWQNQANGLCLGIPLSTDLDRILKARSCSDTTTDWHFA